MKQRIAARLAPARLAWGILIGLVTWGADQPNSPLSLHAAFGQARLASRSSAQTMHAQTTGARALATHRGIAWPAEFRQDVNLYRVCFANRRVGWSVGDRGAILHTDDGGATWKLQDSGVSARLESVDFVDATHGWAVGGRTIAGSSRTEAVIVTTDDGGQTWSTVHGGYLPWLTGVHFENTQRGYAWGNCSPLYPSALFVTDDGGQHWRAIAGSSSGWVDASFSQSDSHDARRRFAPGAGWMLDRDGNLSVANQAIRFVGRIDSERRLPLRIGKFSSGAHLVCGNQGLVLRSAPNGQEAWSTPSDLSPADQRVEFDWQAMAIVGDSAWIAGMPGTRILHTADGGATWRQYDTGQSLPIYDLEFVDAMHGWAIGAMGTILVTQDGGQSWKSQQGEQRRLATLAVFGRPSTIPWEMIAQLAIGEGYYVGVEVLSTDASLRRVSWQTPAATRLHEATVMMGGMGANLIQSLSAPSLDGHRSAAEIQQSWNAKLGTDSQAQLVEYLTRQIRTFRPELILMPSQTRPAAGSTHQDGLDMLIQRIALQAVEMAGDERRFPSQLRTGLTTWRAPMVTSYSSDESAGGYPVSGNRMLSAVSRSVTDFASLARGTLYGQLGLLGPNADGKGVRSYDRLRIRPPGGASRDGAGQGQTVIGQLAPTVLLPAAALARTDVRRVVTHGGSGRAFAVHRKNAQRVRNLETLLRGSRQMNQAVWQQAMHLADELPAELQGDLLYRSASAAVLLGHGSVASQHWQALSFAPSPHRLSEAARLQLFWFLASQEAAMHWRLTPMASEAAMQVETLTKATGSGSISRASFLDEVDAEGSVAEGLPGSAVSRISVASRDGDPRLPEGHPSDAHVITRHQAEQASEGSADERKKQIERLLATIQREQPDLYVDGLLRFPLAAYHFRTTQPEVAIKYWKSQRAGKVPADYRTWAATELALLDASALPPKPLWNCRLTQLRPHLDGQLNDELWNYVDIVELKSVNRSPAKNDQAADETTVAATAERHTQVQIAFDARYLYLAARCDRFEEATVEPTDASRRRDQTLSGDRLELFLDIDRDAMTAWRLCVDSHGAALDALNDDVSWNPKWYIATASDSRAWTLEAAIPLAELSDSPVTVGTTWCLGIQRIVPGYDWHTWMQQAPVQAHREEFGLLRFDE